jgi:hypothetical protein
LEKIRFHECDAAQLAPVYALPDDADTGHQPCAVSDGHGNAVLMLQRRDPQAVFERLRNRLFGIDVLPGPRDLLRERQVLLVRNRQYDALDVGIGKQRLHVRRRRDAQFLLERGAPFLGTAEPRDDLQLVGLPRGAREHLGPAAESDDRKLYWLCRHQDFSGEASIMPPHAQQGRRMNVQG